MKISILFVTLLSIGLSKDCLDSHGNDVDYWFILKLPSNKEYGLSGWEYLYCDSKDECNKLVQMTDKLGDASSPLQKTIAQIQFDQDDEMSILWNDQPYGSKITTNKAHSKGMMTASSKTKDGFVINHSLPNFPRLEGKKIKLGVPDKGRRYAQHFFCVSLDLGEIEKIAKQYKISEIIINLAKFPVIFDEHPNIKSLKDTNQISDKQGKDEIKSKGGLTMVVFSVQQGVKPSKKKVTAPPKDDKMLSKKRGNTNDLSELEDMKAPKKRKIEEKKQILTVNKKHKQQNSIFLSMFNMMKMQESSDSEGQESNPVQASGSSSSRGASSSSEGSEEEETQLLNQGFFSDIVTVGLESNVAMATWGKGSPRVQRPVCTKYKSLSVLSREHQIKVGDKKYDFEFTYKKDHSKIGITFGNSKKWVIVADLNRQILKTSRGGTAICFWNKNLWKILDQSFKDRQKCD